MKRHETDEAQAAQGLESAIGGKDRIEIYRRYAPAYSYGWRERLRRGSAQWSENEPELKDGWRDVVNADKLSWEEVRGAVRAGWDHVSH